MQGEAVEAGFGVLLKVADLSTALLGQRHLVFRFALERLVFVLGLVFPPPSQKARLGQKGVLERGVEVQEAGVFLVNDVVGVVGLLLSRLLVFLAHRLEGGDIITADEDFDQVGKDGLDSLSHIR